ncbi:MAG: paraquat-inducible protein A [Usitatibacter sp.]
MKNNNLIACRECDLLQREVPLAKAATAHCARCGAELFRHHPGGLDRTLALYIAAAIAFVIANVFPIMDLDAKGMQTSATIYDCARELHDAGMTSVAVLVFITAILAPALELSLLIGMLLPLKLGYVPRSLPLAFRVAHATQPWGMPEVFVLGALVALVKLRDIATVNAQMALYATGAFVFLLAAAESSFEPQALWKRAEGLRT